MEEEKKEELKDQQPDLLLEGIKFGVGMLVNFASGSLTSILIGLAPASALAGMNGILAKIGTLGITVWVGDEASKAVEDKIDVGYNLVKNFTKTKDEVMADPEVQKAIQMMKARAKEMQNEKENVLVGQMDN